MTDSVTDRIVKSIALSAPLSRVWRAISDADEFGAWFRVKLEAPFVAGATVHGQVTYPGYEHLRVELKVVEVTPERYLSYRWRPNATDATKDYSADPMTLVEFKLEPAPNGTLLTIVESGFDDVPLANRAEAFRVNENGWSEQLQNIERHVSQ
ncbi:MAG: SRPBCC family protein [Polyangiaceae bacterium]